MKRRHFEAVAVHPKRIRSEDVTKVGVWVRRDITSQQRERLMSLNATSAPGHIGVRTGVGGTAVIYLGRIRDVRAARKIAISLLKSVKTIIGVGSVLQELPNERAVGLALVV